MSSDRSSLTERFAPFADRMRERGLSDVAVRTFEHYFGELASGQTGLIAERDIEPIGELPDAASFDARYTARGRDALPKTVLLKLNGGLATTMGLTGPKALLPVKGGLTFLDIVLRQARAHDIPVVLMNSFSTQAPTARALAAQTAVPADRVIAFEQDQVPKIAKADLSPGRWPDDPRLEWCPPGHGNLYSALATSGTLDRLLDAGFEHAFVSNVDNLGAVIDLGILGWFAEHRLPFMLEVTERTEADKKGGHLARRADGRLILRETAQTAPEDLDAFQDTSRHRYFNTNNLWLSLPALKAFLAAHDGVVALPMIRNTKTIDPRNRDSQPVYQLETAMGAAVELFEGAGAVRVPRVRFAPVKNTGELLGVRSDAFALTDDFRVVPSPERTLGPLIVTLDPAYYAFVDQMEARFPSGPPSLVACEKLEIVGDVRFGRDVVVRGAVHVVNQSGEQRVVADGAVLEGAAPVTP